MPAMPAMQPMAAAAKPASPRTGASYYKDVMAANKEIKNTIKEIKVNKIELAMGHL